MSQKEVNALVVAALVADPTLLQNKKWRLENLYWIVDKDGTKTQFKMNRAQRNFYDTYINIPSPYYRFIILKSRQLGFTTFIALYILDKILFNTNKNGMFVAHKLKKAQETFDNKVYYAIRNMDENIKDALFKVNRSSVRKIQITIPDGPNEGSTSNIQVDVSGRGDTLHVLHVSEFAKLCVEAPQTAKEVVLGAFPAVPFDGEIFIESTAEGMAGDFYDIFNGGWYRREKITPMMSRVEFMPVFYNWQYDDSELSKITETIPVSSMIECEIPWVEYQKEHNLTDKEITYYYMKWQQLGKDVHRLRQEFPTTVEEAFVNSGQMYFPTTRVMSMMQNPTGIPKWRGEVIMNAEGKFEFLEVENGNLYLYEKPERGTNYVIGGDTSEGLAHGDAQCLGIVNAKTEMPAGYYSSQVAPDEFGDIAFGIGKFFNDALLAVEVNKDGLWVNTHLEKKGYTNLFYRQVLDDITKSYTKFFGWKTTSATRPFMLVSLKAVFMRLFWLPHALLYEMQKFVRNMKGRPEAMSGEHDDLIMAFSIAYSVLQERGKQGEVASTDTPNLMKTLFGESDIVNFEEKVVQ